MIGPYPPGKLVRFERTFTAIAGATLVSVTATLTMVHLRSGTIYDVTLGAAVIDAPDRTATFTGDFQFPPNSDRVGMWAVRWDTSADLEDVAEEYAYITGSPVLKAVEAEAS